MIDFLHKTEGGTDIRLTSELLVNFIDKMGDDGRIAAAAWASTNGDEGLRRATEKPEDVKGVIYYLVKNRHGSPFEHGTLQFAARLPLFVWREWHRHRIGWSYNEESGRYKTLDPIFYLPEQTRPMFKVENWRAGRPKFDTIRTNDDGSANDEDWSRYQKLLANLTDDYARSYDHYLENLSLGFDPGLARDGLPVGLMTTCWLTANPRSVMNFLSLRVHELSSMFVSYPLHEIHVAAQAGIEAVFAEHFPITHAAFVANGRVSP